MYSVYSIVDTSSPNLSRETIIIITVSASVAAVIILYLLCRLIISHISSLNAAPLPPVQPLAHHRARIRADMQTESNSNYSSYLSAPPTFPTLSSSQGSKVSLLDSEAGEEQPTPSQLSFPSPTSSSSTHLTSRRVFDKSPARSRSVSSLGTSASRASRRNTIYGTPHGPLSRVQVILPTPLASTSHLSMFSGGHSEPPPMRKARTSSYVDQWVTTSTTRQRDFSDILVHLPSYRQHDGNEGMNVAAKVTMETS